jgi:hypothetical protein
MDDAVGVRQRLDGLAVVVEVCEQDADAEAFSGDEVGGDDAMAMLEQLCDYGAASLAVRPRHARRRHG